MKSNQIKNILTGENERKNANGAASGGRKGEGRGAEICDRDWDEDHWDEDHEGEGQDVNLSSSGFDGEAGIVAEIQELGRVGSIGGSKINGEGREKGKQRGNGEDS